jgi:hypothetical protein
MRLFFLVRHAEIAVRLNRWSELGNSKERCGLKRRRYIKTFESGVGVYRSDNTARFAALCGRTRVVSWMKADLGSRWLRA